MPLQQARPAESGWELSAQIRESSQAGSADTAAAALQSALVVESTGPDWQTLTVGGVPLAWDACGNRRVVD